MLGSNFHMNEGNSQEALSALIEHRYAGKDRGPNEQYPNPYRVEVVACKDH